MRWSSLLSVILVLAVVPVPAADARRSALRLMTYNLNYANPDFASTLDAIAAADADVVLLQEVSERWRDALLERFTTAYPHRAFRIHMRMAGGLAVLSKLPLAREELWAPPAGTGAWFPAERLVVTTPFGALQLLNVHLRPALDRGSWIRGYMTTREVRRKEIEAHWRNLDRQAPTIVAGDFNEDPSGRAIGFLARQGMARVPTTGPTTWRYRTTSGRIAFDLLKVDIDHVMIDDRLVASDARVLDAGTSDHRPVVVTIAPK
jgi:vancomycin resistance protein VanJ